VYSRETTSEMAERVVVFLGFLPGVVLGVVFGVGIFADAVAWSTRWFVSTAHEQWKRRGMTYVVVVVGDGKFHV